MEAFGAYIPMDRRQALSKGHDLPDRTEGSALFADISGFTPLAEALAAQLGPQRGAEELTRQLNQVYEALIAQVHRYGGSVIGFVGDAITCWFDTDSGLRATACALAMQEAIKPFANVEAARGTAAAFSIKVGIATGPARRFRVGDPAVQYIDVLAGDTLRRMSLAEGLARKGQGEVLLEAAAIAAVGGDAMVQEWRTHPETGERFAVVAELTGSVAPAPWPNTPGDALTEAQVRPWVLPPVYERLEAGQGEFLAQLRPAVSLFLKFAGLDYDRDEAAGAKLDAYIRWVQRVLNRYEGSLIQLTIGDKGSFMYAAFGAPIAHEDDAIRATMATLDLQALPAGLDFITSTQIGVAQGQARTGAYGSSARRSYGVIGDDAVLACRLMGVAPAGEIRCDYNVRRQAATRIAFEDLSPVRVKGRAGLVRVYGPQGRRRRRAEEPGSAAAIVGRQAEIARIEACLDAVQAGQARVLVIEGEAGIGKSRLAAELMRLVRERGLAWLLGTGQSIEQQTPYRAWRDVFSHYLGLDEGGDPSTGSGQAPSTGSGQAPSTGPSALLRTGSGQAPPISLRAGPGQALTERQEQVHRVVAEVAPDQIERLPLLNDVLDLGLPETELTAALEPKLRQQSLVALLLSLLRAWARERPLILVLEDAHWLDSLSWELAVQGARALTASGEPLLLVLVTRPLDERSPGAQYAAALRAMANAETLPLITLSPEETVALVTGRLGLPEGNLPDPVAALVRERAGGNPFFAEELVLTLRDQGVIAIEPAPKTPGPSASAAAKPGLLNRCVISGDLAQANRTLPHSIQGLVLARVDRLPSGQQLTLKVASVIGRVFPFRTLHAVHPVEADRLRLPDHLEALVRLDVTLLETPEPELAYAFKHIITQEVAYESLLYAHRRELHHRVGEHLERTYPDSLEEYYELLAHHYVQSGDRDKSWDYLLKAGDKARDKYANEAAIAYYNEALSTDGDTSDVHRVHESLAGVLALAGRYGEALDHYASARALVEAQTPSDDHAHHLADLCCQTAAVCEKRSEYKRAFEWLERGLGYLDETKPTIEAARIYLMGGGLFYRQGEYDEAVDWCQKSLTLASQIATREGQQVMGRACYLLGLVSIRCGDLHYAVQLCRESIHIYQQIDDLVGQANAYNNLASAYFNQGDWARASDANHKSLAIRQEIGDVHGQAMIANNLAEIYLYRGQWTQATSLYGQNRAIAGQIGATLLEAVTLSNLAHVHIYQENWTEAETCLGRSQAIFAEIGSVEGFLAELERRWGEFYLRTGKLDQALDHARRSIGLAVEQDNPLEEGMSRRVLGQIHLARGEWGPAEAALRQSLRALKRLNSEYEAAKTELSLARLAMETGSISMHEAQDHLAQAIETFERLGAQADLAEAQSLAIARKRLRDDRTATTTSALMG